MRPVIVREPISMAAELDAARRERKRIGFVPTMGALHAGHLSLMDLARSNCDVVVASIFVNPLQFGPAEDLARYPRDERGDLGKLEAHGVDVVLIPSVDEMYPTSATTTVDPGLLGGILEGAERPGHFSGVCTVVAKLLNLVQPDVAVFGQKDAQQVAVIKRMVADLSFSTEILVGPTVRDTDGLALSSRNVHLSAEERSRALSLHAALMEGRAALRDGIDVAEKHMEETLARTPGVEPGYARAVDPETFGPPDPNGPVLLVVAARVGATRLIDNVLVVDPVHHDSMEES